MLRINEGSERQDGELLQTSIGQRSGPLVSTIFCGSKLTRSGWPSILQLNSTLFSSGAIVGSPEGVFFGKKKIAVVTNCPFSSRSYCTWLGAIFCLDFFGSRKALAWKNFSSWWTKGAMSSDCTTI